MIRIACVLASWLLFAAVGLAQTPISFSFSGAAPGQSNPWNTGTVIASGLSQFPVFGLGSSGWSRASGLVGENSANRYDTSGWSVTTSIATLIANNDYMGFGISVNAGFVMNLNSATVGITVQRNGQGPNQYVLMSNLPGYGLLATDPVMYTGTISGGNSDAATFNLPATGLAGLTGSYEFRLYGLNASSTGGTFSVGIQNDPTPGFRIFNGTVAAIPEPTTFAMFGLGVAGAAAGWRWRRRQLQMAADEEAAERDPEIDS